MKINWGRVLNAGLVGEILLILVFGIFASKYGNRSQAAIIFVVSGSFVFMLVGALWVARKIESRFILHGVMVGVIAVLYYVIRTLPEVLSGQYPDYFRIALIGHTPKILGGLVGGFLAGRQRKKAGIESGQ